MLLLPVCQEADDPLTGRGRYNNLKDVLEVKLKSTNRILVYVPNLGSSVSAELGLRCHEFGKKTWSVRS